MPEAVKAAAKVSEFFSKGSCQTYSLEVFEKRFENIDDGFLLVLGGDGTLLRVARRVITSSVSCFCGGGGKGRGASPSL
jgi:NAD kinase